MCSTAGCCVGSHACNRHASVNQDLLLPSLSAGWLPGPAGQLTGQLVGIHVTDGADDGLGQLIISHLQRGQEVDSACAQGSAGAARLWAAAGGTGRYAELVQEPQPPICMCMQAGNLSCSLLAWVGGPAGTQQQLAAGSWWLPGAGGLFCARAGGCRLLAACALPTVVHVHRLEQVGVAVGGVGEHAGVGVKVAEAAVGAAHHAHPAAGGSGGAL